MSTKIDLNSLVLAISKSRFTFNDAKKTQEQADDHAGLISSIATQVVTSSMTAAGITIDEVMEISAGAGRLHYIYANRESSPRTYKVERIIAIEDVVRKGLGKKAKIIYEAENKDGELGEEEIITDFFENERENDSFECMNARAILDLLDEDFDGPFFFTKAYYTGVKNKHSDNGTAKFLSNVQRIGDHNDDDRLRSTESEKETVPDDGAGDEEGEVAPLDQITNDLSGSFGKIDIGELLDDDKFLDAAFGSFQDSFDTSDDDLNKAMDDAIANDDVDSIEKFVSTIYDNF